MDFARKQLEKYGWTDGKGLGKNENGISQALKPKLKRSVTGVGHDAASDFTEHWWTTLYNKAAGNVEVEEKNGKTQKIKTNTDDFQISNSTWKLTKTKNKSTAEKEQYVDYFVKKATLTNGGVKMEKVEESDSESDGEKKDGFKMTDEELFAACGGRTAHKGARHGLRALGKLARIEQQEQHLLEQEKYEGYSHYEKKKKNKNKPANELQVEDLNLNSDTEVSKTKKKKKKRCSNSDSLTEIGNGNIEVAECTESEPKKNKKKRKLTDENVASDIGEENGRKTKKLKNVENVSDPDVGCLFKSKKKKRNENMVSVPKDEAESNTNFLKTDGKYEFLDNGVVRKTKKKNKKSK
ncbi:G patch domain-containing protein 4 [Cydia amplana]|uniref:G patch domain-containing protein 4 n=1 Tax=Cydia amplana TaxID=1869771 RepID=UPI002FE67828